MADTISPAESVARRIEVVLMPAYSAANADYDGPAVARAEVREDLGRIVAWLREKSPGAVP